VKKLLGLLIVASFAFANDTNFTQFTGKINSQNVRLRKDASIESPIIQELNEGQHVLVVGRTDDFFAIKPTSNTKFYVYRTYVIDGMIEGHNVNVRLKPDLNAPVVMQLQSGTNVRGQVCQANTKWFEITPPEESILYIAQEFVDRVGDSTYIHTAEQREQEAVQLAEQMEVLCNEEMKKPYHAMDMAQAEQISLKLITQYSDFSQEVQKTTHLLKNLKENYLTKKAQFVQVGNLDDEAASENANIQAALNEQDEPSKQTQKWHQTEYNLYLGWINDHPEKTFDDFKKASLVNAVRLKGTIERFHSSLPTKPGDFLLIQDGLPVAYLYSIEVSLEDLVGKEVSFSAVQRNNNHFAFPAYLVVQKE
jgi:hypothetical protein